MKLALISGGLFLVSYVAVNRGLGPEPLQLLVPLLVGMGTVLVVQWFSRRRPDKTGGKPDSAKTPLEEMVARAESHRPPSSVNPPPRPSGAKARKLF